MKKLAMLLAACLIVSILLPSSLYAARPTITTRTFESLFSYVYRIVFPIMGTISIPDDVPVISGGQGGGGEGKVGGDADDLGHGRSTIPGGTKPGGSTGSDPLPGGAIVLGAK